MKAVRTTHSSCQHYLIERAWRILVTIGRSKDEGGNSILWFCREGSASFLKCESNLVPQAAARDRVDGSSGGELSAISVGNSSLQSTIDRVKDALAKDIAKRSDESGQSCALRQRKEGEPDMLPGP
jgi:hypothetical protein